MNKTIDINTEKLKIAIGKQKKINKEMLELFEKIQYNNTLLKDNWDTRTSAMVFEDFSNLYKVFDKINNTNSYYSSFLENVVSNNYELADEKISDSIDSNIAVE